jgi:2-polyprenyl-3-methyl-5-hydroxy-6-metoxy-1,4-benzoquinol methylase
MVYIETIEDAHALIFDGPVLYGRPNPTLFTSANLDDVRNSWEFQQLPDKKTEWPALRKNATDTLQRIERYIHKPHTERHLLDFGSGWGFFLATAQEQGWRTCGLEPLPASSVYARATFGLHIITDTLHANTFTPQSFDAITAFQVFEHLPHPEKDIHHLYNALQPGGIILIEVPNYDTWSMRLLKSRHRHFVQDHLNFFSIHTLGQLMVNNGFQVIDYYHPTRHMTVSHLIAHWFHRYLPATLVDKLQHSLQNTSWWQKTIALNIGDIITVIGRKPAQSP